MQRYVASRPMFLDAEIMNLDARTVKGEFGPGGVPNVTKGLQSLYKEIAGVYVFNFLNTVGFVKGVPT